MSAKGKISYSSPSNIAIIKYWGKQPGNQIPMNPSVSMTLDKCRSFTTIEYEVKELCEPSLEVYFAGSRATDIEAKLQKWFDKIAGIFPWLSCARLRIETRNNFPHSAGIASSASGMSALAMCLSGIDEHIGHEGKHTKEFHSNIARLGSGSASRSVTGPWVLWGESKFFPGSANDHVINIPDIHADFVYLHDTIIVVDKQPKSISSRQGHSLMDAHPYRSGRIKQTEDNLSRLTQALKTGDWNTFSLITENEALSLHALMLASEGGMMLWRGDTIEWMHFLRQQRQKTGIPLTFTLDAGANIHLLYPPWVHKEIVQILAAAPVGSIEFIHDHTGTGPEKLNDDYEQN
ncbi:MAG: diphosphomevalonate/mevalonate 3,5-bisphosphate decarboxylase family protein [Bacteroidota bacterium]